MSRPARLQYRLRRIAALLLLTACAPLAQANNAKAAKFYEDALSRYERRDIAGAIIQLKNALQIDKTMLPVQTLLAKALLANGEAVAAEVAFNEALKLGVNRAEVVVPLARAVVAQGNQRQMLENPLFNVAGLPSSIQVDLLLVRAAAASDIGDTTNALKDIEQARALDPRLPEAWMAEVPVRVRAGQFREAHVAADKALGLAPGSAEALYQKAQIAHAQADANAAFAGYSKALAIDKNHIEARIARTGLLMDLGKFVEAKAEVAQLQTLAPREPRAVYMKAVLAEQDGDAKTSVAALRQVTELIDPMPPGFVRHRPQLLLLGGLAHYALGQKEKAMPYLETLQRIQGKSPATKLLAQLYLADGNADRSIEILEAYLSSHAGDAHAISLLAGAYMAKGRSAKATALMQDALKGRDLPEFRTVLGISLISSGKTVNAQAELEAAFKRDPKQVQAGVALIGLHLKSGQAAKAVAVAQSLVKLQPEHAGFQNLLGVSKAQARDWAGARKAFEQSLSLDARFVQPKLGLARLDLQAGNLDAAAKRLGEIINTDERNVEAMYDMAVLSERRRQTAEAVAWLEKAANFSSGRDNRAHFALVEFHLRSGNTQAAFEAAKRLLAKAPDDVPSLTIYARAQLANNESAGAKQSLVNASRRADFDAAAQHEIASLQMQANDLPGALYSLSKALSAQADHLPSQILLAEVLLRQGDMAKAEQQARLIIERQPRSPIGHDLLASVQLARNQQQAALDSLRRAHELQPTSNSLLRWFFVLLSQDGGKITPQAQQLATQWLQTRPNDVPVRKALTDAQARSGNFAGARKSYEQLLKQAPNDVEVLNNLANVLLQLRDPQALTIAEQALAKAPGSAQVIDTAGWANFQAGKRDRALQLLRDARLRAPDSAEIRYHLAAVLAATGRKTEARDELLTALRTSASFDGRAEAGALLETLK